MIRRALWPVERALRLFCIDWLLRELSPADRRVPELVLERQALERTREIQ